MERDAITSSLEEEEALYTTSLHYTTLQKQQQDEEQTYKRLRGLVRLLRRKQAIYRGRRRRMRDSGGGFNLGEGSLKAPDDLAHREEFVLGFELMISEMGAGEASLEVSDVISVGQEVRAELFQV
jgi:hypothetical protein